MCGADLHIFEGSQPDFECPREIGYELAGEEAMRSGAVSTGALVTRSATLEEAARAFSGWLDPANRVVKALIEM